MTGRRGRTRKRMVELGNHQTRKPDLNGIRYPYTVLKRTAGSRYSSPAPVTRITEFNQRKEMKMAYITNNLSVLAYANNFTLWHYRTEDKDISVPGYFNNASPMLRANDLIIANTNIGSDPSTGFYVVTSNEKAVVCVAKN